MGRLIGDGIAWFAVLLPLALIALIWGMPPLLDGMVWFFQGMRDFVAAVKG